MKLKAKIACTIEDFYYKVRSWWFVTTSVSYFFKDPPHDEDIYDLEEILDTLESSFIRGEDDVWTVSTRFHHHERKSRVFFLNEFKKGRPTLLYCPPSVSTTKSVLRNAFLGKKIKSQFNILFIFPAYYEGMKVYLQNNTQSFLGAQLTFSNYIVAIEEATQLAKSLGSGPVTGLGLSMSGIALSWHAHRYGTLDKYLLVMAIPNLPKMMFSGIFRYMVDEFNTRRKNPRYEAAFNLPPEQLEKYKDKIRVRLNRYDKYVNYDVAIDYWKKVGSQIDTEEIGHLSTVVVVPEVRRWIWSSLLDFMDEPIPYDIKKNGKFKK